MRLNIRLLMFLLLLLAGLLTAGAAVASPEGQATVPVLIVNTGNLNVRAGPSADYAIVTTVPGGTQLPVLGVARDGVWYLVATLNGNGWVNREFTIPRGSFAAVPTVGVEDTLVAISVVPAATVGQGGVVVPQAVASTASRYRFRAALNVESINLRATPEQEGQVLRVILWNRRVDYELLNRTTGARNVGWLQINVPGVGAGWVEEPKMRITLDARYRTVLTVIGDTVGVLERPAGHFLNVPPLHDGDEVWLLDMCCASTLVKVELASGAVGWIPFSSIVTRENTTTDILARGGTAPAPTTTTAGQGGGGVTFTTPFLALPTAIVNTGNLNVRTGPGPEFGVVATVPGGTHLSVLGMNSNSSWYLIQGDFGQGWIDTDYIIFRGNINVVPTVR